MLRTVAGNKQHEDVIARVDESDTARLATARDVEEVRLLAEHYVSVCVVTGSLLAPLENDDIIGEGPHNAAAVLHERHFKTRKSFLTMINL
eukprot:XP_001706478.1 Hypothetical protein GL50803_32238 [Giardia lamblia ATCC 50803]